VASGAESGATAAEEPEREAEGEAGVGEPTRGLAASMLVVWDTRTAGSELVAEELGRTG